MLKVLTRQPIHILKIHVYDLLRNTKQSLFWPNIIFQYDSVSLCSHQLTKISRSMWVKYSNVLDQGNYMWMRLHALKDVWTQRLMRSTTPPPKFFHYITLILGAARNKYPGFCKCFRFSKSRFATFCWMTKVSSTLSKQPTERDRVVVEVRRYGYSGQER